MADGIFWIGFGVMLLSMVLHYITPLSNAITNAAYGAGMLLTAYAAAIHPHSHGWERIAAPTLLGAMGIAFIVVEPVRAWLNNPTKEESNGKPEAGEGQGDGVLPEGPQGSEE